MADGVTPLVSTREGTRGLTYPHGEPPAPGEAKIVADGVLWLRLPLPMALNHINIYAIADGVGWAIVDTGIRTRESLENWEAALAGPLGGLPVTQVICTHMHPDHLGLAGWLCERFDAPLKMTQLEYVTARMLLADAGPAPDEGTVFYRAAGWDTERVSGWQSSYGQFGRGVHALPQSYTRIVRDQVLRIGGEDWRVVVGNGHSPEHACLWRQADGVFISGDQILPRISSNISIWPTEPLANPLQDWMTSLDQLAALLPDELLVLPGHGDPFTGVKARLEALTRGHEISLTRLERALQTPKRAVDVFSTLFARAVGDGLYGMATGESLAHLNYLEAHGRARRDRDADGVDWWTATNPETTT